MKKNQSDQPTLNNKEILKPIPLDSWEAFEEKIEEEKKNFENKKKELKANNQCGSFSNLLFRGQSNADWSLETTLERYCKDRDLEEEWSWRDYNNILQKVLPAISSLTTRQFKLSEQQEPKPGNPDPPSGYELMVYMRHHGFPSPLLDWTRSPYVAAYFAFNKPPKCKQVAIYSFMERAGEGKITESKTSQIWKTEPYIKTHPRHYNQQCEYTHCFKKEDGKESRIYCSHENVKYRNDQDILKKYTLPASERNKVMLKLDLMNINAFSLFGNEEGLMDMLAYREIENGMS